MLTITDPRYPEFLERLTGPEGCDFQDDGSTNCAGGTDKTYTMRILRAMGYGEDAIAATLAYFETRGGFCDCEIVLNAGATAAELDELHEDERIDRAVQAADEKRADD